MMTVLRFLFASDYPPWPFQVVWKTLTLGMCSLLTYLAWYGTSDIDTFGVVVLQTLGVLFFFFGVFGKLGDG